MQNQKQDYFDQMPVLEARWLVVCCTAVIPLWIWPSEISNVFTEYGISILKAMGWIVGLGLIVVVTTIMLSVLGNAILKGSRQRHEETSDSSSRQ